MSNLKNIIIVNDFDYIQGGASKVAIDTANLLCNEYDVYFFSADSKDTSVLNKKVKRICTNQGEVLRDKNKLRGFFNGIYNIKAKKEMKKLLCTLNPNETIIHVHGWTKALSCSIFDIAFKMNFKVVLTLHDYFTACPNGGYFNYKCNKTCNFNPLSLNCIKCNCDSRNYFFKLYRVFRQFVQNKIVGLNKKLTDVISISDFSEKILKKTLNTQINIHRIYNPIKLEKNIDRIDFSQNKYFLYVGRVSAEKGVELFCQAITYLRVPGIVVGDGALKEKLQLKYKNIEFVGWKSSEEVINYMKKAKVLIFPSIWYETAGLTALEAQNIGLPVIISSETSTEEFSLNKEFVFKKNSLSSLISKMKKIDDYVISTIDSERYSYDEYFNKLIKLYGDLL